ncbi:MAG: hypothetical protein ACO25L_06890 [Candidatus Nanopelagicales bacterium]|jgi:hypothetical protein
MTNTTYTDFPFTANGVKFISRVFDNSPFISHIKRLPEGAFASLNIQAVLELVGDASLLTRDELLAELEKVNDGGSHAFILLDEESN